MFLGAAILVALLIAWALGLRAPQIVRIEIRGGALVFVALAVQLLLFVEPPSLISRGLEAPLHVASYVLLMVFLLLNRRPGLLIATLGLGLNALVIIANGGRMPISLHAWTATGRDPATITATGAYNNNVLAGAHAHLAWLGDIFALPASVPLATAISVGDLLILTGMIVFVATGGRDPWSQAAALREPLRVSSFRRLIAGRAVSDLGDFLTMTAIVTWLYERDHSVALVSTFLIVRILAGSAGGLAAASLLHRLPYFRTLAIVAIVRGVLTVGVLVSAVSGQIAPVFLIVCISAAVGSATSPSAASLVPELLPGRLTQAGNSLHGVAASCAFVLGAALGAASVGELGIGPALGIDLASFAVAAALYRSFAHSEDSPAHEQHRLASEQQVPRREIFTALLSNRVLLGLTASFTIVTGAMGLLNASLPGFLSERLGEPAAYGYGLAAIGAGLFCGQLLAGIVPDDRSARRGISLAFAASALILLVVSSTEIAATAYLMLFALGCADGTTEVARDSLVQQQLAPRLRAGGFSISDALQRLGMATGFAAAPVIAHLAGPEAGVKTSAILCLVGAAIAGLLLAAKLQRGAADPAAVAPPTY